MKISIHYLIAFLMLPVLVWAEPETDFSKISDPPADAPTGEMHDGVQIGLWTEKPVYEDDEIRNVWRLAKNDRSSGITIGIGGSIYNESFLYITRGGTIFSKLPFWGGIDGIVNPTRTSGGISMLLADLPVGTYQLTWRTEAFTSNTITIEIRQGEQAEVLKP